MVQNLNMDDLDAERHIVPVLSCVLNQLVMRNDKMAMNSAQAVTIFHALKPPTIGIKKYLERILKYAYCSNECFVLALIYIDRLIQRNPHFVITSLNVHRLLITAVMLAAKFFDDTYCNNAYYAKVGGVAVGEINSLEIEFLFMINFSLHVTPEVFDRYRNELLTHAMNTQRPCLCGDGGSVVSENEYENAKLGSGGVMQYTPYGATVNCL